MKRLLLKRIAGKRFKFHITDHYSIETLELRGTHSDGTTHSHGTTLEPADPPVHIIIIIIRKHAFNSFITSFPPFNATLINLLSEEVLDKSCVRALFAG